MATSSKIRLHGQSTIPTHSAAKTAKRHLDDLRKLNERKIDGFQQLLMASNRYHIKLGEQITTTHTVLESLPKVERNV